MQTLDILKIMLNLCEAAACAAGFLHWNKIKHSHWKWFPVYLAIIVAAELTGKYLTYTNMDEPKRIMYDYIVVPMEILFFHRMFYKEFSNTKAAYLPLAGSGIYIAGIFIDSVFLTDKHHWFLSYSYTLGVALLVIYILVFLFKLAGGKDVLNFKSNFVFWVCVGLLMFYLGSLLFHGIFNTLYKMHNDLFIIFAYFTYIFNCLMYLSFLIAFKWGSLK